MSCITDFLNGENVSSAIPSALKSAMQSDRILYFPAGVYHFYPDGCSQRYCFFSNNDEGVKTIAILLDGVDDFTVRGDDAKFLFHGRISPLCAFNCRNLIVEGISIDFEDSFVSDADLVSRENGIAWFKFSGKHQVVDGKMVFTGDFYDNFSGRLNFYCYDCCKKELVWDQRAITIRNRNIQFKNGLVGVEDKFENLSSDAFVVKHENRLCPGMVFDNCPDVTVRRVTVHHAAGMGVLIQNSENCLVEEVAVVPENRRTSASDDALHITDCRGKLRIKNCELAGTLDDSINVHGVFRKLKCRTVGNLMYYLEAGHFQQQGVFNIHPGDTLELLSRDSGKPYAQLKIAKVIPCTKAFTIVSFESEGLPPGFVQGDPGWILGTQAELEVTGTVCRPLNGRGVLASGLKDLYISGCHLHSSGSGVFISGDHGFWYESGPVQHALIENNIFDNCNYKAYTATREPLAVFPELNVLEEDFYYHGTIEVVNNTFISSLRPQVSMMSVRNAVVTGNTFTLDDRYGFAPSVNSGYYFTDENSPMAAFLHCENIVDDNPGFAR